MFKQYLNPENFTKIMGAYSHGLKIDVGNAELFFITGQIAMDKNGKAVAPGDFTKQAEFIFENIQQILKEGGASLDEVVKAIIYITDMEKYSEVSAVRNKYFVNSKPASTLVEISRTVTKGCDVEIEVIAIKKK